ncbi:MAG: glycosyltransferase [Ruminococcaceae bacterium]|nr:glycosyltransferase [Oscillospiraceae bacterium]
MKKVAIIGPFRAANPINGQTVKTKNLRDALAISSETEITEVDTYCWKKHPIRLLLKTKRAMKYCDSVVMLPAHNGVKIFSLLLLFFNRFYKKKLYYNVIGGWLPQMLSANSGLLRRLQKFDGVWVETNTMKNALAKIGMKNVEVLVNFKDLVPLKEEELNPSIAFPVKLVVFSRVSALKGVSDAMIAIKNANAEQNRFTLDIYGPIDGEYQSEFDGLLKENKGAVTYRGVIDPGKSVAVLKDYDALLFPTKSYTEGIPGTIIDAYCAGLPVVSAKWESYGDICYEGSTALGYTFGDTKDLQNVLNRIAVNPEILVSMRKNCLIQAEKYIYSAAAAQLMEML